MKRWALAVLFVLVACDGTTLSPSLPPTTTTSAPVDPPPRVDQPFSWDYYQGFTAFALGHPGQTEEDVKALYAEAMSHGWNTARICAETEFWDGDANYPRKPRDLDRLDWLLHEIATIPGSQALLIAVCTTKGPVPIDQQVDWVRQVAEVASQYHNVALEVVNEFDNCRGRGWGPYCPGKQDIRSMIEATRQAGVQFVTSDDSLCYGPDNSKTYQFRLANVGASPADFHPCRERGQDPWDPDPYFLQRVHAFNGDFVLSETVAFMDYSGQCNGLRTCDQERIQRFVDVCAVQLGCHFTFHSENLLAGVPPTWWPEAR